MPHALSSCCAPAEAVPAVCMRSPVTLPRPTVLPGPVLVYPPSFVGAGTQYPSQPLTRPGAPRGRAGLEPGHLWSFTLCVGSGGRGEGEASGGGEGARPRAPRACRIQYLSGPVSTALLLGAAPGLRECWDPQQVLSFGALQASFLHQFVQRLEARVGGTASEVAGEKGTGPSPACCPQPQEGRRDTLRMLCLLSQESPSERAESKAGVRGKLARSPGCET